MMMGMCECCGNKNNCNHSSCWLDKNGKCEYFYYYDDNRDYPDENNDGEYDYGDEYDDDDDIFSDVYNEDVDDECEDDI